MKRENYVSGREDRMSKGNEVRRLMYFEATRGSSLLQCKGKGREWREVKPERQSGQFTGSLVRHVRELVSLMQQVAVKRNLFLK